QPQTEICDGKDNDCNGVIDDVYGGCSGGNPGYATGCIYQGPEVCDRIDNDCNGYTDDIAGGCVPNCVPSGPEVCDDRDNDCNGFTDDVPGGCGTSTCLATGPEICDGRDNDCNGIIDDVFGGCVPSCVPAGAEICDGKDNDCNGLIDDIPGGCVSTTPPPSSCVPQSERCNGADDDCDGFPDEGNPEGGDGCTIYTASMPFAGVMMCISGQLICQVNNPGTSSFTGALAPIRGAGCAAVAGDNAQGIPALTFFLLLLFGWKQRRRRSR
ncbi:MAG: hypothetical protein JRH20_30930, partial [Deltaproteobacteria bacterium]|nr:hypothetical protein [Deltaproteobacteria bacterium]